MEYYIAQNDETNGPYTIGQLRTMWNSGAITGETLYCQEGWSEWLPLSAMIEKFEPPASILPQNAPSPLLLLSILKSKLGKAIVVGLVCLGAIILFINVSAPSNDKNEVNESVATQSQTSPTKVAQQVDPNEPMSAPKYGLDPIPMKFQNQLIDTLTRTDDLDAMIKRGCTFEEFTSVFNPIEQSAQRLQDALPLNDPRMHIFLAAYERYQVVAVKLSQNASQSELSDADLFASLPKVFLLKILNGTLDENEQKIFDDMKQQIKAGTLFLQ